MDQAIEILRRLLISTIWIVGVFLSLMLLRLSIDDEAERPFLLVLIALVLLFITWVITKLVNWIFQKKPLPNQNSFLSAKLKLFTKIRNQLNSEEGNYASVRYFYKTNDNRNFNISENGWHLINIANPITDNPVLSAFQGEVFKKLSEFAMAETQYNYLVHPPTMEGSGGDHIGITTTKPISHVTRENLEKSKSELFEEWSKSKGHIKNLELDLTSRREVKGSLPSAYARVQFVELFQTDDCLEEYFSIQREEIHVIVHCSASSKNIGQYRKIMFEIVDSIEL